jgi:hypothetical protein
MFWTLSRYRAGDLVEVCSREEIVATLDERACVDEMPFMPEMFRFCGHRFRVRAVAHKTCETARQSWKGRRLRATVHLEDLRCDGSAHGGCQAACTLYWKDVWLKPVSHDAGSAVANGKLPGHSANCTEELVTINTLSPQKSVDGEPYYCCQATKVYDATQSLPWWDARQYILDVTTGNHSVGRVLRVLWLSWIRQLWRLVRSIPLLRRLYAPINEWMHQQLTGCEAPYLFKKSKPCEKTPTGRLDLKPGELVRVKSKSEIEETLDAKGWNRGLSFDPEEMALYCGRTYRVASSVTRIIDEGSGKMRPMKQPCIILEGVVCNAEFARCRLNCPRKIPAYWREIWLERIEIDQKKEDVDQSKELCTVGSPGATPIESLG